MMETSTPYLLTILFTYNIASLSKGKDLLIGMKWADFVNLSIIIQMASLPLAVLKRLMMRRKIKKAVNIIIQVFLLSDEGISMTRQTPQISKDILIPEITDSKWLIISSDLTIQNEIGRGGI